MHTSKKERGKFIDDKYIKYPIQYNFIELKKKKNRIKEYNKIYNDDIIES